jgi:hypothetical protein
VSLSKSDLVGWAVPERRCRNPVAGPLHQSRGCRCAAQLVWHFAVKGRAPWDGCLALGEHVAACRDARRPRRLVLKKGDVARNRSLDNHALQIIRRQGDAANAMRWQHNRLVAAGITDKRARFQSQQALRGVARLQQVPPLTGCSHVGTHALQLWGPHRVA